MRLKVSATVRAGSVTTALAVVLWLAVQAGTAGGETPFPVSDWAGPSYGKDPPPSLQPLHSDVGRDATKDRQTLARGSSPPAEQADLPPRSPGTPAPSPSPSVNPTPHPSPGPTVDPEPTPSPTPTRRYSMDTSIAASRASARPGESYSYTIRIQNTGTETLHSVFAETHIPQGTSEAHCSGSGSFRFCTSSGSSGTGHRNVTVGTLGVGEVFTYTYDVIVNNNVAKGQKIRNHAHGNSPETGRVSSSVVSVVVV